MALAAKRLQISRLATNERQFLHFRLTYSFTRHFFFFLFTTLHIHNLLIELPLSFSLGLKPICFTNPTLVVSLLPPGLPSWTIAGSFLLSYSVFYFSLIFLVSVPCARWPYRHVLSAR